MTYFTIHNQSISRSGSSEYGTQKIWHLINYSSYCLFPYFLFIQILRLIICNLVEDQKHVIQLQTGVSAKETVQRNKVSFSSSEPLFAHLKSMKIKSESFSAAWFFTESEKIPLILPRFSFSLSFSSPFLNYRG